MSDFVTKTIKFLGKSPNPTSIEVLLPLLDEENDRIRYLTFDAIYYKKNPRLYVKLFEHFVANESKWERIASERLTRITDAALRAGDVKLRDMAADVVLRYKLYEILPFVVSGLDSSDEKLADLTRNMLIQLSEFFYNDLAKCPSDLERRNLDRRRDWFVQQLDVPIKRYAVNKIDEVIRSLLIVTKKDYDPLKMVVSDHRSMACQRASELLLTGSHGSYIRLLLSFFGDLESPAVIDEIISQRSDKIFVQRMLEIVGVNPTDMMKDSLKRFKGFVWLDSSNAELTNLISGCETQAVQLTQYSGMMKDQKIRLYRYFLRNSPPEAKRAAVDAMKWIIGDDVNALLLESIHDPDPVTCAMIFRLLKSREVREVDQHFARLVERPEEEIRKAIYDMIPELHIELFESRLLQMEPETAKVLGRYVRIVDPFTLKVLSDDIFSPIPIRRLTACMATAVTGYAERFQERLIEIAIRDDDNSTRVAAIHALSGVLTKDAVKLIKSMLNEHSISIRDAATTALKNWMTAYQARIESC
ncbi:MAG: HEAT repeat domain-containing protein [Planctomycetaceae bacterium]|nr:HEAT repeat domain-containing protein [Planctomycetaceae bacterium]